MHEKSIELRADILTMLHEAGSGHAGGSLSLLDVLLGLYTHIRHDPKKPQWPARDRVILSAGHLCPALYAVLADKGYFPKEELKTLRKKGSRLQGHPEAGRLPGLENTSGPLGQGYAYAVGKALAGKLAKAKWNVYCLASDGEHDEGAVWEAAQLAAHHALGNLCVIIDRNDVQIEGRTKDIMDLRSLKQKYKSFGWHVIEIDGHNHHLIKAALEYYHYRTKEQPCCIIAHTKIGKGISFMEDDPTWHGRVPSTAELDAALSELERQRLRKRLSQKKVLA